MKQEEKDLLLKDLSARLLYKVKGIITHNGDKDIFTIKGIFNFNILYLSDTECCHIEDFKPYLFPLSSMTEEQKEEYRKVCELDTEILSKHPMDGTPFPALHNSQDWLDAHHFDYRGLIEKGLAIDATNLNIY
jgi:hypothetical protein